MKKMRLFFNWLICSFLIMFMAVLLPACSFLGGETQELESNNSQQETSASTQEAVETKFKDKKFYYYYDALDDFEKRIYKDLLVEIKKFSSSCKIDNAPKENICNVMYALVCDHPEIFWLDDVWGVNSQETHTIYQDPITGKVIRVEFNISDQQKESYKKVKKEADKVIKGASNQKTDYDKVKYFYDYLVNNVEYAESAYDQDIRSVFIDKKSVCAGYSKAFQYLCQQVGIESYYVEGIVNGKEAHAWNQVKVAGKAYWIDVTWGKPIYMDKDYKSKISYAYFLGTDKDFEKTHKITTTIPGTNEKKKFEFEPCTDVDDNYFHKEGYYFTTYNFYDLLKAVKKQIDSDNYKDIELKFANDKLFEDAKSNLVGPTGSDIYQIVESCTPYTYKGNKVEIKYVEFKDVGVLKFSIGA